MVNENQSEINLDDETEKRSLVILRQKMEFYNGEAERIIIAIIKALKKENKRGDLLHSMYKELARCNDIAIDCAAKLAPFEFPKLQSQEVKQKVEHTFVVRVPAVMHSPEEWLDAIGPAADPKDKLIEHREKKEPVNGRDNSNVHGQP